MNAVGGWLVGLLGFAGTVYGGWVTLRNARATRTASPYDALAKRTTDLELADERKGKRIAALERDLQGERAHSARQDERLREQDQRIRKLQAGIADWQTWYQALLTGWAVFRNEQQPPPAPGPTPLDT